MNTNANQPANENSQARVAFDIRHLTVDQLAQLGLQQLAYIRPIIVNGEKGFAIHAADGTPMAIAGDRDVAVAAVLQHEMVPASVH
ncbi:MAG TPA: DUF1150 family protein [Acetobacteraceae bacterium]|nr:DUF1150 family protein [Acetobacteraceae bacterium]